MTSTYTAKLKVNQKSSGFLHTVINTIDLELSWSHIFSQKPGIWTRECRLLHQLIISLFKANHNIISTNAWTNLHLLHQTDQMCACWGMWTPEQSSCPLWQKTWLPWKAEMIKPKTNQCSHIRQIDKSKKKRKKKNLTVPTLRKQWALERSSLGWLLAWSLCSRVGMPFHFACLSLSISKCPGN